MVCNSTTIYADLHKQLSGYNRKLAIGNSGIGPKAALTQVAHRRSVQPATCTISPHRARTGRLELRYHASRPV